MSRVMFQMTIRYSMKKCQDRYVKLKLRSEVLAEDVNSNVPIFIFKLKSSENLRRQRKVNKNFMGCTISI